MYYKKGVSVKKDPPDFQTLQGGLLKTNNYAIKIR
jgi:hypothetical protein